MWIKTCRQSRTEQQNLKNVCVCGGGSPLRRQDQLREMESERCAPPGALFAEKTTAVISPNRGTEAIIIEHQHALCVHTVHKSTNTHGLSPNNRSKRPH